MKTITWRDFLVIIPFLVVAIICFMWLGNSTGDTIAIIEQNGKTVAEIDLSSVTTADTLQVGNTTLLVEPGAISFAASDCPDQVCVRTGKLTLPGQAAVCLPERVSVRISGFGNGSDAMTG